MNGRADARIGAAAAQVSGHGFIDVGVAGCRVLLEQGCGAHDLARLAVAALGDLVLDPGRLHGVQGGGRAQTLDRGDGTGD